MKDLFVPYELALLAREKGFDEPCLRFYQNSEDLSENLDNQDINHFTNARAIRNETYSCLAPLYQQLIDWFFNNHKIIIRRTFTDYEIIQEGKQILFDKDLDKALGRAFTLI